jgi:hypothetical protein
MRTKKRVVLVVHPHLRSSVMGERDKANSDGIARDATRVFFGVCLVRLTSFDPSNGFGCGYKKDTVSGSCLQ